MSKDEMSLESRLVKLKQEVRGVLLSCPRGLTINQFLKDYKDSIGRSFPFSDLGYESIPDLLRDISDVVKLKPGYRGESSVLVPVSNEKVSHINSMVSQQKLAPNKFSQRPIPRRIVIQNEEPDSGTKTGQQVRPLLSLKTSFSPREEDARQGNDKSSGWLPDEGFSEQVKKVSGSLPHSEAYCNNNGNAYDSTPDYDGFCEEEVHQVGHSNDFVDQSDYSVQKGFYDMPEEAFEIPPTPGAVNVSEKMKHNMRELLAEYPDGILSSKFCKMYHESFGVPLRYEDYGTKSFQEFIAYLPDVFSFQQQKSSTQWVLYDPRQPLPTTEMQKWIPYDILTNLAELAQSFPEGVKKSNLFFLYREMFHAELDMQRLGFNSLEVFLQACSSVDVFKSNGEDYVVPKSSYQADPIDEPSYPLPHTSDMPYLWGGYFSDDECDPSMCYQPFDTVQRFKTLRTKVLVCDVISPSSMWLQMDEHQEQLKKLMLQLNEYYDVYEQNHVLNNSFVKRDLVCAVRFAVDNRWHRAKVLSYSDSSNKILVRYVDYGTDSLVDISAICKLKKTFYNLPVQAVEASLYGVVPKPQDPSTDIPVNKWTVESVDFIYDLCFDKKFSIDYLQINDSATPQLQLVMSDGNSDRTVNDELLAAGHAVSIAHMSKPVFNSDQRIRTPPGYVSRAPVNPAPHKLSLAPSTCDRVVTLKEESLVLHREVERLQKEIKQKLLESDVLQQLVCKHNHPGPSGFDVVMKLYGIQLDQPSQEVAANNNFTQDTSKGNECVSRNVVDAQQTVSPSETYAFKSNGSCVKSQQGFNPVESTVTGPDMRFNHVPEHVPTGMVPHRLTPHQMCQSQVRQQPPYSSYAQQIPPVIHNKLVGAPLIVPNQSYMGVQMQPFPPFHQQQNMMYHPNVGQWGAMAPTNQWNHGPPPGMYEPFRPASYPSVPPATRPPFVKTSPPKMFHPPPEPPVKVSSPPPKPTVDEEDIKPTAPPPDDEEVAISVEPAEEVIPPEDDTLADEVHEDRRAASDTPPPPYNAVFLSQSRPEEPQTIQATLVPPPDNCWSTLITQDTLSNNGFSSNSKYPNQALLELMTGSGSTDSKEGFEAECNNLNASVNSPVQKQKQVVNHTMRICMENIHGRSSHVLLVLVEDSVAILLKQLFLNYWWDEYDETSYQQMKQTLIDDFNLAYSISLHDYPPIFHKLKEENLIAEGDLNVYLVNLCHVPDVLDAICPLEKHDLSHTKDMFVELSKLVLPVDEFWFKRDRSSTENL